MIKPAWPRVEEMRDMIDKLQQLGTPDRVLDVKVARLVRFRPDRPDLRQSFDEHEAKHGYAAAWIAHHPWHLEFDVPKYTEAFSAAETAIDSFLPDVFYIAGRGRITSNEKLYAFQLMFGGDEVLGDGESDASLAVAALIALFDTLIDITSRKAAVPTA